MKYPFRQTYRQDEDTYIENRGYAHRVSRGEAGFELLDDEFGAMLAPGQTATPAEEGWQLEDGAPFLDAMLAPRRAAIDAQTSARIMAGFVYELDGMRLRFSYDIFDQQNFADTANACLMAQLNPDAGLPRSVTWNAYDNDGKLVRLTLSADKFLSLYTGGALAHKAACMEAGGQRKAALAPEYLPAPDDWWQERAPEPGDPDYGPEPPAGLEVDEAGGEFDADMEGAADAEDYAARDMIARAAENTAQAEPAGFVDHV